jgi:hypothetical protein
MAMFSKKTVAIVLSLVMLVLGVSLTYAFSGIVQEKELLAEGTITVPANGYQSIRLAQNLTINYHCQINAYTGTIQVFTSYDNTPTMWVNGSLMYMWDIQPPMFNGSSGQFSFEMDLSLVRNGVVIGVIPCPVYVFFFNPNSSSESVHYNITYNLTIANYFGLLTGIALISLSSVALVILKFKNRINNFIRILGEEDADSAHSGQLENFAKGVLSTTSIIWIVYCLLLIVTSTSLLFGSIGLIVLVVPFGMVSYQFIKKVRQKEENTQKTIKKVKDLLISLQGFGIACWLFDIFTTFFALDVIRQANSYYLWSKYVEVNPLGWPLGIVVGLIAYVPSGLAVYYLLYKIKTTESLIAALFIAGLSFGVGFINLFSGIVNSYAFALGSISNAQVFFCWIFLIVSISFLNLTVNKRGFNN